MGSYCTKPGWQTNRPPYYITAKLMALKPALKPSALIGCASVSRVTQAQFIRPYGTTRRWATFTPE